MQPFPVDHLPLRGAPDADALVLRDTVLSFEMLNLHVGQLARYLCDAGMKPGDRVASWCAKGLISCLLPLAAPRAGLIHVPVNPLLKEDQLHHILSDSGAVMLIANQARLARLAPNQACSFHEEKAVGKALAEIDDPLSPLPQDSDTDALVAIFYTSGSTGRPKGVMLSHANLSLGALSVADYLQLRADDRTLCVLPLAFDYGQNQLLSTWAAGAAAIPLDYLVANDVIKACARHAITTLAAVPPLWVQLVEHDWPAAATASLRRLTNSGGALTPRLVGELRRIFGHSTDIYAMYGLTEAFRSTFLPPALIDDNPTSMGRAIPHAEILVVKPDGTVAAPGEEGELVHCGPLVAHGYWRDAARTALRFKPAPAASRYGGTAVWSGDTVRTDKDGLLYFVTRDDAMIKSAGNRISPGEIEEAVLATGTAIEAVALGVPDDRLGQAIRLFIRPKNSGDPDAAMAEISAHLKHHLPNFMQPQTISCLKEFPKNPNGKIDRVALAKAG
ncbi:MAG: acyl-CoA ligase (AMP-forming), exosortase A system-associated [Parasphingorhabdus sp.]|nr:acyl-CoA ligase (AMP-forming), exosortase A system-associated [Parasphingorhabdus sp.]